MEQCGGIPVNFDVVVLFKKFTAYTVLMTHKFTTTHIVFQKRTETHYKYIQFTNAMVNLTLFLIIIIIIYYLYKGPC